MNADIYSRHESCRSSKSYKIELCHRLLFPLILRSAAQRITFPSAALEMCRTVPSIYSLVNPSDVRVEDVDNTWEHPRVSFLGSSKMTQYLWNTPFPNGQNLGVGNKIQEEPEVSWRQSSRKNQWNKTHTLDLKCPEPPHLFLLSI